MVEYDTVSKAMACMMDDKAMDNVVAVNLGQDWDDEGKFNCAVYQLMKDEANDSYTRIITTANQKGELTKADKTPEKVDIVAEVSKYFSR